MIVERVNAHKKTQLRQLFETKTNIWSLDPVVWVCMLFLEILTLLSKILTEYLGDSIEKHIYLLHVYPWEDQSMMEGGLLSTHVNYKKILRELGENGTS
jgi:hypothetical protein